MDGPPRWIDGQSMRDMGWDDALMDTHGHSCARIHICAVVAGLCSDMMKVRQKRMMMQHQLQAADPHGGGGGDP